MEQPVAKFKLGDVVRDTVSGKTGPVSALYWSEGDEHNKAEWACSIDHLGWLFIGESDLEIPVAVKGRG